MIDATLEVLEQTARGVAEGSAAEQRPASASAAAAECAEPTAAHAPLR
jgi:hypothetical protein